ncbi:hypothetical protein [Pleionea sp. CnH1-48]|uniref:hypothetical protein n=1 Tax=Pleionea sp. CnH1-48 TaxID=2954494 RepID=UPI002098562E|nr:hypothetical protein [Pleionea sp. CnH1-48]MCO7227506.1 hypothetical protein [Pleionea sp. CnH1-48]
MTLKAYDLYGFNSADLDVAKELLNKELNIELQAHESRYHCGEYFRFKDVGEEHFILQKNHDDFENEWTEESFSQYPVLLYVNEAERSEKVKALLEKDSLFKLLEHELA